VKGERVNKLLEACEDRLRSNHIYDKIKQATLKTLLVIRVMLRMIGNALKRILIPTCGIIMVIAMIAIASCVFYALFTTLPDESFEEMPRGGAAIFIGVLCVAIFLIVAAYYEDLKRRAQEWYYEARAQLAIEDAKVAIGDAEGKENKHDQD
jgi:hypothetical protein